MPSFTITVDDKDVQAKLKALSDRVFNIDAVLQTIGEGIIARTKRRFETSTDPAGHPWKTYPPGGATLTMLHSRLSGQSSKVKKDGSLNAAGQHAYAGKRLLIGESQDLRRQFTISVRDGIDAQISALTAERDMLIADLVECGLVK